MVIKHGQYEIYERKIVMRIRDRLCETPEELFHSDLFMDILSRAVEELKSRKSVLINIFGKDSPDRNSLKKLISVLEFLAKMQGKLVSNVVPDSEVFFADPALLNGFVEYLYNYWRSYERIIVCESIGDGLDKRPYRTFNSTVEFLTDFVRKLYRDIQENIVERHPCVYRQVKAGAEFGVIALSQATSSLPEGAYERLSRILLIRQVLLNPPLILQQPMNKRTGAFHRVKVNPLEAINITSSDWLCYPAKVGSLVILIYLHKKFYELGLSMCNLFELADDDDLRRRPDAVFCYGVEDEAVKGLAEHETVFFDDEQNNILVGAVPRRNEFGYFGYLKKMILTLHNVVQIKHGILPFHGALMKLIFRDGNVKNVLFIGDTGAGKSESIEALRAIGNDSISDIIIVADDMGSLRIENGKIRGYGTEIGAFLRLDDLDPGFAFGQIDRAIIMSPSQTNARIVMPVTTLQTVLEGVDLDMILYANNYEEIDDDHPLLERFSSAQQALSVFRDGTVMSKGTTTSSGITHSYFANVFGPPQYKSLHDEIAGRYFQALYEGGVFVGQIRTRLGIPGMERTGPEAAAKRLLAELMSSK
jgi:hypothetical protein